MKKVFEHSNKNFTAKAALLLSVLITLGAVDNSYAIKRSEINAAKQARLASTSAASSSSRPAARPAASAAAVTRQSARSSASASAASRTQRPPRHATTKSPGPDTFDQDLAQAIAASLSDAQGDVDYDYFAAQMLDEELNGASAAASHPGMSSSSSSSAGHIPAMSTNMPLPPKYHGRPIYQLRSARQAPGSNACGIYSVLNAYVIERILYGSHDDSHGLDAFVRTQIQANNRFASNKSSWTVHQVITLAAEKGLRIYPLCYDAKSGISTGDFGIHWGAIRHYLLQPGSQCAHFVCNTGGHWLLISMVKRAGEQPVMLILDSTNGTVKNGSITTRFIDFLAETFLQ